MCPCSTLCSVGRAADSLHHNTCCLATRMSLELKAPTASIHMSKQCLATRMSLELKAPTASIHMSCL